MAYTCSFAILEIRTILTCGIPLILGVIALCAYVAVFVRDRRSRIIQQPQGLISVLNNTSAEFGDREDAAMDLGGYDEPEAEDALTKVILDPTTDPSLAETVGESLAEIWSRKNDLNIDVLQELSGEVLLITLGTIEARRPEWKSRLEASDLTDRVKQSDSTSEG